jgi:ferredoxin
MDDLIKKAQELLETQAVSVVIGYGLSKNGNVRAVFPRNAEDCKQLIYNENCNQNLAIYLMKHEIKHMGKRAVVATVPVMRTILQVASEQQLTEEDVVILPISPEGKLLDFNGFKAMEDYLASQEVGLKESELAVLAKLEGMSMQERWDYWQTELSRCFKCYACRAACPMCYCTRCFVEVNTPQWIPISANEIGNFEWHMLRGIHLAGRCINCGECGRACPLEIPIHLFTYKMVTDVKADFDVTAGLKSDMPSLLSSYNTDDKETFIR